MFKKLKLASVSAATLLIASNVMAHSGHDHSSPESGLIHLAWLAPLLIVGAFISYRVFKNKTNSEK